MSCCRINKSRSLLGIVASAILVLLVPKCPLCIAAYAATLGVGLSVTGATIAREILLAVALVLVGVWIRRLVDGLLGSLRP